MERSFPCARAWQATRRYCISSSPAEALRCARLPDVPRMPWTDAVCISQYDHEEKAQQVSIMSLIYRKAAGVLAWLGPAGLHTAEAITAATRHPYKLVTEAERDSAKGLCSRLWVRGVW
jgi:hypothetical protein